MEEGSIAQEMGIEPGDELISVNDTIIEDIFDYQYLIKDELITLLIKKPDGEEWELEIEKDPDEDLGIDFAMPLMDPYRSCHNRCIFCFIDQNPPGMRETIYFKDDDSRLSFPQGNYVTLTNMSDHDIDRIIRYRMEPINISFHTMNPQLRCMMLGNRFAGEALKKAYTLKEAGIEMNGQIVLCKGINDGPELERSLREMENFLPCIKSLSVVPVGLTRYREGLYKLEPFESEDAARIIDTVEKWQDYYFARYRTHLVHASDELYIMAGREFPSGETYDGYLQIENGVGMMRSLYDEVLDALSGLEGDDRERDLSMVTGTMSYPVASELVEMIRAKFPGVNCRVYSIKNDFFGERITVSGLLTGGDICAQLKGRPLGSKLLLSTNMIRSGENVFLDDMTTDEVSHTLQTPVEIVESGGYDLVSAILK